MEKEEIFKKMQEDFVAAGKKDEFIIAAGALQAGLKPEEVEKYMTSKLSAEQLLEQIAGMLDGLSKQTLSQFAKGSISAEDMQIMRLNSRGDSLVGIMLQEIRNLSETILDMNYGKEITDLSKSVKDMKKEFAKMKEEIAKIQKPEASEETIEDIQRMEAREQQQAKQKQRIDEAAVESSFSESGENTEAPSAPQSFAQPEAYKNFEKDVVIQRKKKTDHTKGLLSFFRHMNSDRIEQDEEEKRLSVIEFVKDGLDDEKLEAVSEAVRCGVPYDHLRYLIDKQGNAEKIRKMTQIYLYLFSSSQAVAAA